MTVDRGPEAPSLKPDLVPPDDGGDCGGEARCTICPTAAHSKWLASLCELATNPRAAVESPVTARPGDANCANLRTVGAYLIQVLELDSYPTKEVLTMRRLALRLAAVLCLATATLLPAEEGLETSVDRARTMLSKEDLGHGIYVFRAPARLENW